MAEYCGWCYMTDDPQPFGYCKKCWIKADKPEAMKIDAD